jgi:hypothetical protein
MANLRASFSGAAALAAVTLAPCLGLVSPARAAVLSRSLDDSAGSGFFDATPAAPVGGNPGTTVGQQRINVLDRALEVFARRLQSTQTIRVFVSFSGDGLTCTATAAVLGGAAADHGLRYSGPAGNPHPRPGVVYHAALFDRLAGDDGAPGRPDVTAAFNDRIGSPGCAEGMSWYYGFDGRGSSGSVDLFTVMLHELAHALGFSDFSDRTTGEFLRDSQGVAMPGVFALFLYDNVTGKLWPDLTPEQRLVSRENTGALLWDGPAARALSASLPPGSSCTGAGARMRMFAPGAFSPGSSISHWDTTCTPDLLMEPVFTGRAFLDLTPALLADLGWQTTGACGDGNIDEGEQCDRGAGNGTAGCSVVCSAPASGVCGDGAIGPGEQCDQGSQNGTARSCCSASCTPVPAGTTCRPSAGACDVAEVCSGQSGTCPGDAVSGACMFPETDASAGPTDAGHTTDGSSADAAAPDGGSDAAPDLLSPADLAPGDGSQVIAPLPDPSGGCACDLATRGAPRSPMWWLALAILLGLRARRSRR